MSGTEAICAVKGLGGLRRVTNQMTSRGRKGGPARPWASLLVLVVTVASSAWLPALAVSGEGPRRAQSSGVNVETQRVPVDGGHYTNVSAAGLATMLAKKDFPLINVHVPYEGEIEGTDLFLPFDQVGANVARLPTDKSAKVVLYCRSGHMSAIAARALVGLGYTDVWNVDGGMIAWIRAGHPVAHKRR
jgi:rhodanese-related sulfurtransferase